MMSEKKIVKQTIVTQYNPIFGCLRDYQVTEYSDKSISITPYYKLITLPKDLYPMKTKITPKKKAVKKKLKYFVNGKETDMTKVSGSITISLPPYELFKSKNGTWKWRKRAKNRAILNHSYNTKAAAIKGMKADFAVTKAMDEFEYREVKS